MKPWQLYRLSPRRFNLSTHTKTLVVQYIIEHKPSIEELITLLQNSGGRIHEYYLRNNRTSKQTLVYLNGWHSGANIREAITKALSAMSVKSPLNPAATTP